MKGSIWYLKLYFGNPTDGMGNINLSSGCGSKAKVNTVVLFHMESVTATLIGHST